eukprot:12256561-Alexandrium_andersonii.AAC.1
MQFGLRAPEASLHARQFELRARATWRQRWQILVCDGGQELQSCMRARRTCPVDPPVPSCASG